MKTIPITRGKFVLVDDEDFASLSQFKWCCAGYEGYWYAMRKVNGKMIRMHRVILGASEGQWVDHKNGNGLDNQRGNLRIATPSQNSQNSRKRLVATSRFKGVCFDNRSRKWRAVIQHSGKERFLGNFDREEDAAKAYDKAASDLFGEFALVNSREEKHVRDTPP
jgi:AP2 domain/HNH endonuclease